MTRTDDAARLLVEHVDTTRQYHSKGDLIRAVLRSTDDVRCQQIGRELARILADRRRGSATADAFAFARDAVVADSVAARTGLTAASFDVHCASVPTADLSLKVSENVRVLPETGA